MASADEGAGQGDQSVVEVEASELVEEGESLLDELDLIDDGIEPGGAHLDDLRDLDDD